MTSTVSIKNFVYDNVEIILIGLLIIFGFVAGILYLAVGATTPVSCQLNESIQKKVTDDIRDKLRSMGKCDCNVSESASASASNSDQKYKQREDFGNTNFY